MGNFTRQKSFLHWAVAGLLLGTGLSSAAGAAEVARVNGKVITEQDIVSSLAGLNEGQRSEVLRDSNSRHQIVTNLVDQEVLVEEAEKQKLDQDQEYREATSAFRRQYLANRVLQKNLAPKLTEAAARRYYDAHKEKFSTDQVHAMHILTETEEQARDLMKQAKAGADFQGLAEKYSRDPSAKNNRGDLGFFGRDRMVPEFTDAAFGAREGEIVGPVKTAYGYHIIKVIKKRVGKPLNYDEVELRVKNDLRQQLTENYVGKLRSEAKVKVNQATVDKM